MHRTRVRVTSGVLWFVAVALMWELAWSLLGVPRIVGPFLAAAVGIVMASDPLKVIWGVRGVEPKAAPSPTSVKPLAGGRLVEPTSTAVAEPSASPAAATRHAGIDL